MYMCDRMGRGVWLLTACALAGLWLAAPVLAGRPAVYADARETRTALAQALRDERAAQARAAELEAKAARTTQAADRTARQAAALAARIQHSEAAIATGEARLALITRQRAALRDRLARKQEPVMRLTAALQTLSRRPLALSVFQPGSLRDVVYLRAVLASAIPQVERRTAALRGEIARSRALERVARQTVATLRKNETQWAARRKQLAALETRQRLASRQASGVAAREADRALALAEEAQDLDGLVGLLDQAAQLARQLEALPGPILRPPRPEQSQVMPAAEAMAMVPENGSGTPPAGYRLPVSGRIVSGFGSTLPSGLRSDGIGLAPRALAQAVTPAGGRVAFAGPYRGYGRILIVDHGGGWTSLVTGLARIDARVGDRLVAGAPLGIAGTGRPVVTLELRRGTTPVNPLEYL